jgi:hypothetical protein
MLLATREIEESRENSRNGVERLKQGGPMLRPQSSQALGEIARVTYDKYET